MSKIGTSAARNEVNTVLDEIWRISCHNEKLRARQWARNFDYLVPEEKKRIAEEADDQVCTSFACSGSAFHPLTINCEMQRRTERQQRPYTSAESRGNGRKALTARPSTSGGGDPHFSELTLVPEPPQRRGLRDKYDMKQDPARHNANSKMLKYYNQNLPPNKTIPSQVKDHRAMLQHDIDESIRKTFSLNPHQAFERRDLYQYELEKNRERRNREIESHEKEKSLKDDSHIVRHAEDMVKTQFRIDSPHTRYNNHRKLTSHDYGWLPSLEFPGKSSHGLKTMRFE